MTWHVAYITIGIDPKIHLGPLTLAWHGLTIAIGILLGALLAGREARARGLSDEPLWTMAGLIVVAALVGGRLFYVAEHGGPLFGTYGFTFDGGVILAAVLLGLYVYRRRLTATYLDVVAAALPLGIAVGRIGDVINGEHYGARSTSFLAVRNSNPDAGTPNPHFAYQNGGLYEVLLAALIFLVVWPLRGRVTRRGDMAWLVLALFAVGRFFEFFVRSDSPQLALGLSNAQWTSIALLVAVVAGRALLSRRFADPARVPPGAPR